MAATGKGCRLIAEDKIGSKGCGKSQTQKSIDNYISANQLYRKASKLFCSEDEAEEQQKSIKPYVTPTHT